MNNDNLSSTVSDSIQLKNVPCDSCGSTESEVKLITQDNTNFSPGTFNVVRCRACGLLYLNPRPSEEALSSYYEDDYYAEADGVRFNPLIETIVHWFRKKRIGYLGHFVHKGRILDVGSDRGTFLSLLRQQGWEVYGTQLSYKAAQAAKKRHGVDLQIGDLISLAFPSEYFDVVVLWHVLEHVSTPSAYVKEIARILKPGGMTLIEVPNAGSLQARLFRDRWLICEAPRHLYFFDQSHLCNLLRNNKLELLDTKHFSLEIGPFTMLQSMLNVVFSNDNYLFNLLKSKHIFGLRPKGMAYTTIYLLAAVILMPASFLLSFFLSLTGSGEVIRIAGIKKLSSHNLDNKQK